MAMVVQQTASSQQPTAAVVARALVSSQPVSTPSSIPSSVFLVHMFTSTQRQAPISSSLPLACFRVHQTATAAAHLPLPGTGGPTSKQQQPHRQQRQPPPLQHLPHHPNTYTQLGLLFSPFCPMNNGFYNIVIS
ncbi:unnamed protein product [Sphagnum troendelagicum]|uniref:Uncharacterized protein n=1 Tax=Sphagnum troendelagicum TaxID=128251 RepID=A0ABP0TFF3_9BRYO